MGMTCDEGFAKPAREGGAKEQAAHPNLREEVLKKDTNYGVYGTFPAGTSLETIRRVMKLNDAKMQRWHSLDF